MKNYFIPPGKLNGSLYGPYYGGSPAAPAPVDTAAILAAQNAAAAQQMEFQAAQYDQMMAYQSEREAFALSQRDNETQVAMMEQSIQEAMESLLAGEMEEQEEAEEGGQINLDFTTSLLDAMQNYGGAAMPGTGGGLTGSDPNQPNPTMGGGAPMGRPV
mgnify:CR=1 FL=1|tara:strand:- start:338 stop:814 length:477 start_codon:yes stop_codon:yes gene_type:complete